MSRTAHSAHRRASVRPAAWPRRLFRLLRALPTPPGRNASIAAQLLGVFVAALLLVTAMIAVNVVQESHNARRAVAGEVTHETSVQASDLGKYFGSTLGPQVSTIADQPGLRTVSARTCPQAVAGISSLIAGGVALVRPDGRELCHGGAYAAATATDWFQRAARGGFAFGGGTRDPHDGLPQIGYAYRFSSALGPLLVVLEQPSKDSILDSNTGRDSVFVMDADGTVLDARPDLALVGRSAAPALWHRSRSRTLVASGPDGARGIYAVAPIPGTQWWVASGVPMSRALAAATAALQRNLVLGGLLLLVLLVLGLVVHRRIAVPTRRLRDAIGTLTASDVTPADLRHVPETGPRELASLGHAFNAMVDARVNSEARLASLVRHASDLVLVLDGNGTITYATPSAQTLLGADPATLLGTAFLDLVHPDDQLMLGNRLRRWARHDPRMSSHAEFRIKAGADVRDVEARAQNLVDDPAVGGLVVTCHDITDRKVAEARLAHAAMHDALTGLPNRSLALDRLRHTLARNSRTGASTAVLFVDLDRFKLVNDSNGHEAGDELLVQVAARLSSLTRPSDTLARFGGDEFVVICDGVTDVGGAISLTERLLEGMSAPVQVGGQELFVTASVGIAMARPGDEAADVLRDADAAMYRAKERGRAGWAVFDDGMRSHVRRRLDVGNGLRRAVNGDGLFLEFQPVVALRPSLDAGAAVTYGVEALLRWKARSGVVRPDEFIPVAEETGLIVPIGEWVLREACRQLVTWRRRRRFPLDASISVNVSTRQLNQPDFVERVDAALAESGLDPRLLTVEVTESVLMDNRDHGAATLARLRALGVAVSIDDFGTGYSSLGYLERLPIDELKIDRSLVAPLGSRERAAPIIESVVDLAHAVGLAVVAEGVEEAEQARMLADMGCDLAQGYHFARPLSAEAAAVFLQNSPETALYRSRSISATRNASSIA